MAIIAFTTFVLGVRKEQFDGVDSAAVRMLFDNVRGEKPPGAREN